MLMLTSMFQFINGTKFKITGKQNSALKKKKKKLNRITDNLNRIKLTYEVEQQIRICVICDTDYMMSQHTDHTVSSQV